MLHSLAQNSGQGEVLQQLRDLYEKLKKKVKKRKEEVSAEKRKNEAQDSLIQDLLQRLQAQESSLEDLKRTQEVHQASIARTDSTLGKHDSRLTALEGRSPGEGSSSGLNERVENLERRADESDNRMTDLERKSAEQTQKLLSVSEQAESASQHCRILESDVKSLTGHVEDLAKSGKITDERSLANQEAIESLRKLIKQLEEALRNKADADALDQLRGVLSALSSKSGGNSGPAAPMPMLSTKDLNLLKELDRRVTVLEENRQNNGKMGEVLQRLEALEREMTQKVSQDDHNILQTLVNKLRADLERLERWLRELEDRPAPSGPATGGESGGNKVDAGKLARLARRVDAIEETLKGLEGLDLSKINAEIKRLWEAIEELRAAMDKLRKDLMGKLRELEDMLGRKVDMSVITELESKAPHRETGRDH